jgi:hypothetical protein
MPARVGLFGLTTNMLTNLVETYVYLLIALFIAMESGGIPFAGETVWHRSKTQSGSLDVTFHPWSRL